MIAVFIMTLTHALSHFLPQNSLLINFYKLPRNLCREWKRVLCAFFALPFLPLEHSKIHVKYWIMYKNDVHKKCETHK